MEDNFAYSGGTIDPAYLREIKHQLNLESSAQKSLQPNSLDVSEHAATRSMELVIAPYMTTVNYPNGLNTKEEKIMAFFNSYNGWILKFAEQIVDLPDSGYAVLAMINSYFDMIAQLHQGDQKQFKKQYPKDTHRDKYKYGLQKVFLQLNDVSIPEELFDKLYMYVRCSTAHMSMAGQNIILIDSSDPVAWKLDTQNHVSLIKICPRLWLKAVKEHLIQYTEQLRNDNALYSKFEERCNEGR